MERRYRDYDSHSAGGGGRDHRGRRGRVDDTPSVAQQIGNLLFRLGTDDDATPERLVSTLLGRWDATKTDVVGAFYAWLGIYATFLAFLALSNSEAAEDILRAWGPRIEDCLRTAQWRHLKNMLRFTAEMAAVGLVTTSDLLHLLGTMLSPLDDPIARQERKDCFAHLVLAALPWAGSIILDKHTAELMAMLEKVSVYVQTQRGNRQGACEAVKVFRTDAPYEQPDTLHLLLKQILDCQQHGWQSDFVERPYMNMLDEFAHIKPIPLPEVSLPMESPDLVYPSVASHFELMHPAIFQYRGNFTLALPPAESIDRYLLFDMVEDALTFFEINHNECIEYLVEGGLFYEHPRLEASSAARHDDDDHMDHGDGRDVARYNLNQIIIEAIFENLFRLPAADHKPVYYGILIMDLCRRYPKIFPPILGRCIHTVYTHVGKFDVACQQRFGAWFAHHLSNFDFRWNWDEWTSALNNSPTDPKYLFLQNLVLHLLHLSYHERLIKAFPPDPQTPFLMLLPEDDEPVFTYAELEGNIARDARNLLDNMRQKFDTEVLRVALDQLKERVNTDREVPPVRDMPKLSSETLGEAVVRHVIVSAVLFMGSKSFSHTLNAIERNLALLHSINSSSEAKMEIVRIVASYWAQNKLFLKMTLDKFINYRVVDPATVIDWVFSEPNEADFCQAYLWDVLTATINKVNTRVLQVVKRLEAMRVEYEKNGSVESMDVEGGDGSGGLSGASQEKVSQLEHTLDVVRQEQRQTYVAIFEKFVSFLKKASMEEETPTISVRMQWAEGMMREVARRYNRELSGISTTLEMTVFSAPDIPDQVRTTFQQVKQLHA